MGAGEKAACRSFAQTSIFGCKKRSRIGRLGFVGIHLGVALPRLVLAQLLRFLLGDHAQRCVAGAERVARTGPRVLEPVEQHVVAGIARPPPRRPGRTAALERDLQLSVNSEIHASADQRRQRELGRAGTREFQRGSTRGGKLDQLAAGVEAVSRVAGGRVLAHDVVDDL